MFMEYILNDTDIFDEELDHKFGEILNNDRGAFEKGKSYVFKVSFHVNHLNSSKFQEFNLPVPSKTSKGTAKEKIYDVMSYQLKRMEEVLKQNEIESYSTTIQGDNLKKENIIRIEIHEDTSEPAYMGRGKSKRRMRVSSVVPSLPFTQDNVSKLASERLSKIYGDLMNIIRNKKIMSEILEIEATEDDEKLIEAFVKQYGALWLTTKEKEKALLDRLYERCISVVSKYTDEKENME